ncbi:MAG: TlpA family protein disulfide reductase [Myxococcales bacterium]
MPAAGTCTLPERSGRPSTRRLRAWPRLAAALVALALAAACPAAKPTPTSARRSPYEVGLPTAQGDFYSLEQLRGRVALITFFATWCFPCMLEVPNFEALQRDFGDRGFQVVGVGMDLEGRRVLEPFVESYGVNYPVLVADDQVRAGRSPFGAIKQLPTTYLLDREGKVAAAYTGPANPQGLRELVARLVEQGQ